MAMGLMTSWSWRGLLAAAAPTPTPAKRQKEAVAQERGGQLRGALASPGLPFPWTWESAAIPILWASLPSSLWHPGPASLSPTIQAPNSRLSALLARALAFRIPGWAPRGRGRRWRELGRRPPGAELQSAGDCDSEK